MMLSGIIHLITSSNNYGDQLTFGYAWLSHTTFETYAEIWCISLRNSIRHERRSKYVAASITV